MSSRDLEVEDDEDFVSGGEEEQPRFAPELKLFVGNLPFSVDSAELADLFSHSGTIEMVEGFLVSGGGMESLSPLLSSTCASVVAAAACTSVGSTAVAVHSGSGGREGDVREQAKLFVGGIPWDATEETLRGYFGEYGDVVDTVIMKDKGIGNTRGFGFISFTDPSSAEGRPGRCRQARHPWEAGVGVGGYSGLVNVKWNHDDNG